MNRIIFTALIFYAALSISCENRLDAELKCSGKTRTVSFMLSTPESDFTLTRASATEKNWKVYGFDDEYRLTFSEGGSLKTGSGKIEMELEQDRTYRLLFAVADKDVRLPEMSTGDLYWDLGLYRPELPIANPEAVMVSKGNDKGLLKLETSGSTVRVGLVPLAARIRFESADQDIRVTSVRFENAGEGTFWSLADNFSYTTDGIRPGNGLIEDISRTGYTLTPEGNTCYILPDICTADGMHASLKVRKDGREENVDVALPRNMALKMGAGKTYYAIVEKSSDNGLKATWAVRSISSTGENRITFDEDEYLTDEYTLTEGIEGHALDLGENSYNRNSIFAETVAPADFSKSFTTGIWVRTDAVTLGTKAILTNKNTLEEKGIAITTQDNGSWMFLFTDGTNDQWEYRPTHQRQPVNDGNWHFLAVSFDKEKEEIRMYYDGLNVAIYSTGGNNDFNSGRQLRLGGIDGTSWNCFNGAIDEFFFTGKVMKADEIGQIYTSLSGKYVNRPELAEKVDGFRVMNFNIWHGGHEFGEEVGVRRVVEVIREANPDIVGIIETYGSGEEIADALGYYFHLRSNNLSIMSRFPIEETYDFFDPFQCSAAAIRVSESQKINYINLWLNYLPSTHDQVVVRKDDVQTIVDGEWTTRAKELKGIMDNAAVMTSDTKTPMIVSGDFNSDSHLDWCESAKDLHYGYVLPWPTSILMEERGFTDSYREIYPDPVTYPCLTWSPFSRLDLQYRIDFIYYRPGDIKAVSARMIDSHPVRFPSDHAAITTDFIYQ